MRKNLSRALVLGMLLAGVGATNAAAETPDHQDAPHIERGTRDVREVPIIAGALETKSAQGQQDAIRIGGADRFETAALISQQAWSPELTSVVFISTGDNFPDALASSASFGGLGPLLLVHPNAMTWPTQQELMRLQPCAVVVLGSEASVASYVADEAASYANEYQSKCDA